MKTKNLLKKLLFTIALCTPLLLNAQADTRGMDFWFTFGSNAGQPLFGGWNDVSLQIRIVGSGQATTGNIHFTELGTSVPFSVTANGVFTYDLTYEEMEAVYNYWSSGGNPESSVSSRSVRITSSAPVMVYALNQAPATTDATNLLPVPVLGTDHFQISYTPLGGFHDAYAVVAVEDNTRVYHAGTLAATLNAGQVYFRTSEMDMTGTRITSDKPIAFFVMTTCINVPVGFSACDVQFQQLAPVNTWGRNFFVPVTHVGVERVRIVASQDGTDITVVGGTLPAVIPLGSQNRLTNLDAGQWVELEIRLADRGAFIQANNPVGVCSYLVGVNYPGNLVRQGDPSTAWVPAIEQMIPSATIAPFIPLGSTNLISHFALVVVQTAYKDLTTVAIGGGVPAPISGGTWYDHPTAGYSYYILQLPNNAALSYTFSNPEGLFVMGYGLGQAESYYYIAGSAFRRLDAAFFANDVHNQDLVVNPFNVSGINFRAEIQGDDISTNPGHIRWFIDGVEDVSLIDQLTWNRNFPNGTYSIVLEILTSDNFTIRRIEGTLIIAIPSIVVNPHIRKSPQ